MKKIITIFKRDLKVARRDFVLMYVIVAPILIALLLSGMAPDVAESSILIAVDNSLSESEIDILSEIAQVQVYDSYEGVVKRVSDTDDIYGIVRNNNRYEVVLEGNEAGDMQSMMRLIISYLEGDRSSWMSYHVSNVEVSLPPIVSIGSSGLIIMSIILGGMVMGLNIVEDKEFNTLSALNTSPLIKLEYILGKSILGIILPIIHTPIILMVLGIGGVSVGKTMAVIASSALFVVFVGLFIGTLGSNQLSAIASAKGMMFVFAGSVLGAIVLKSSMHFVLYWSPLYWIYQGIYKVIVDTASWNYIVISSSIVLAISVILFYVLMRYQKKHQSM
jgi:ABC-2 type transport system permease protein